VYFSNLKSWFDLRIEKIERNHDITMGLETGAKAEAGLPFLGKLFASFTSAIKSNASYKNEIRREVRDSFSEFVKKW
jgi:hypothetical protein